MFGDGEKPVFKGKSENCMVQKVRLFDGIFKAWGVSGRYISEHDEKPYHKELIETRSSSWKKFTEVMKDLIE